ncbi:phosphoserine aminotransferase [Pedobacter cryoconitis]|uniref:Phosphoserine aminotransferase n=1 Tax=Pedobacter cryoconitis TaxID=188932 RepID=A0A7W9DL78_9SPHI|nr:3-phosphoserine/phosphohydroxythreonine transaminase [Pedobacter cryoconitis]MBB5622644.1 phosphoserine aminotransferase [Pedobacter cryoconitis]
MTIQIKHNFGAGPCILPASVLEQAAEAVKNWDNSGLSILEVSHRSPKFEEVMRKTEELVRELLEVPEDYAVLFLQGGASTQFSMIPQNFLQKHQKAAYLDAGLFGHKSIKEAKYFGQVEVVGSSAGDNYSKVPEIGEVSKDTAYFHCTSNNTIEGTEMFEFPDLGVPLICDMSSDIFSRVIPIKQFDLVYAGAQKNMGPAGMTLVLVKNELLDTVEHAVPSMSDYRIYRDNQSMFNTPPVYSIYVAMLNLQWLKANGGVAAIEKENIAKAALLYAEIERNPLFFGMADQAHRSRVNVCFKMHDLSREEDFLSFAAERGMVGIKGYRTAGGFRASLYNALRLDAVKALVACMQDYEKHSLLSYGNN